MPTAISSDRLGDGAHQDLDDLADEVRRPRHRRSEQPLEHAVLAFGGDGDGQVLEAGGHEAAGDHARGEQLAHRDALGGGLAAEDRPEQDEQDRRQPEDERDRHLVPEERLDLDAAAGHPELPRAGQGGFAGSRSRAGQRELCGHGCSSFLGRRDRGPGRRPRALGRVTVEPGDLAAELAGQLRDRGRRRAGLDGATAAPSAAQLHPAAARPGRRACRRALGDDPAGRR